MNRAIFRTMTPKNRGATGSDLLWSLRVGAKSRILICTNMDMIIIINQRPLRALSQVERRAARRAKISSLARGNRIFFFFLSRECDMHGMSSVVANWQINTPLRIAKRLLSRIRKTISAMTAKTIAIFHRRVDLITSPSFMLKQRRRS